MNTQPLPESQFPIGQQSVAAATHSASPPAGEGTTEGSGETQQHEVLFIEEHLQGFLHITVQGMAYTVPKLVLWKNALGFRDILTACNQAMAGNSAANPCVIPELDRAHFEGYVYYRWREPWIEDERQPLPRVTYLEGILIVATRFLDKNARAYAISELHLLDFVTYPAVQRIFMAREHRIHDWLPHAFQQLVWSSGPANLTEEDTRRMNIHAPGTYFALTQAWARLDKFRHSSVLYIPRCIHDTQCAAQAGCTESWANRCRVYMALLLHQDGTQRRALQAFLRLRNSGKPATMLQQCWDGSLAELQERTAFCTADELIVQEGVEVLVGLYHVEQE